MDYFDIGMEAILVDEGTFTEYCMESYLDELGMALESDAFYAQAMESVGKDSISLFSTYHKQLSGVRKEMNAAAKAGDYKTAAKKARECAGIGKKMAAACDKLPADASAGSLMRIALTIVAILAAIAVGAKVGSKTGLGDKLANSDIGKRAASAYGDAKLAHTQKAAVKDFKNAKGVNKVKSAFGVAKAYTTDNSDAVGRRQATNLMQKAGAATGGAIAGGMAAGGSALAKFIAGKKGKKADEMNPNEKSMLFKLVKQDAKLIEKGYLKKAEKYDAMAKGKPAKESFIDALESYSGLSFSDPAEESETEIEAEVDTSGVLESFLDGLYAD